MLEFSIRGKSRPEDAAHGANPEMSYFDAAQRSNGVSFVRLARGWIRLAHMRVKQRLEVFTSTRGMTGAGMGAHTRFQTSFGAFAENSALEKINLRLKSLENDWIETEKAYQNTQKIWNDVWDSIKQFQRRRELAGDEKEKSERAILARSEEAVIGSFDLLLRRVQDLQSRLAALLMSARP
jgi:hypothetical protein